MSNIFDMSPLVSVSSPDEFGNQTTNVNLMEIDTDHLATGVMVPPLPPAFFAPIGAIIVAWGDFEVSFDELLKKCLVLNGKDTNVRTPFRQRISIFSNEVGGALAGIDGIPPFIDRVIQRCDEIYYQRNMLAHGVLTFSMSLSPSVPMTEHDVLCHVSGEARLNGQTFELKLCMQDLKTLFYRIMALHTELRSVCNPDEPISEQHLPTATRDQLRNRFGQV